MADFVPLAQLALQPLAKRSLRAGWDHQAWYGRVAAWRTTVAATGKRTWAVVHNDPIEFAAILWGAWLAGATTVLPPDGHAASLQRLGQAVDGVLGQGPAALSCRTEEGRLERTYALPEDRTCLVLFTSGSTGDPALIGKTLGQLGREVEALEAAFGPQIGQADIFTTVSHQHIYGLLYAVLWPLAAGRPLANVGLGAATTATTHQRAILVTSPAYLKRLLSGTMPRPLAALFSSGGPLPPEGWQAAQRAFGVAATEVYGSSETGGIAWRRGPDEGWQPLPGVQTRMAGKLLAVRAPHIAGDSWLTTADEVTPGPHGFILLGRTDRIVKVEEKRISLGALERALVGSPWVSAARALALPGSRQLLGAVVVLNASGRQVLDGAGKRTVNDALGAHVLQLLGPVAVPRRWHYTAAIPTDCQGKTTEALLRSLFPEGGHNAAPPVRWLTKTAQEASAEIEVKSDLAAFAGHFPQAAVLAGMVQVHWAAALAQQSFALPPHVMHLKAIKFLRWVRPDVTLTLVLVFIAHQHAVKFTYTSAAGVHSSGRLVWAS